MNRIAVYRVYSLIEGVLHGSAFVPWNGVEMTAECMRGEADIDKRRNVAREHLEARTCLCGIHGFYNPGRLVGLIQIDGKVIARAVLGGVVDVRSEGARGEFAVVEEMWSPPWNEDWLRIKYGVPVNRTPWEGQPYLEPELDDDVDEVLGALGPNEYHCDRLRYYVHGLMIPGATQLRTVSGKLVRPMQTATGRIMTGTTPGYAPPKKRGARMYKDGRPFLTLKRIFADGKAHKRAEVIDYWHARQDGYPRPPRVCFRHPNGPTNSLTTAYVCSCGPLDRGSGMREMLLRMHRDGLIDRVRHGWWKITRKGRKALRNDGRYMVTGWRR